MRRREGMQLLKWHPESGGARESVTQVDGLVPDRSSECAVTAVTLSRKTGQLAPRQVRG